MLDHPIDAAPARPFAQGDAQFSKTFFIAAGDDFDIAIFGVAHPAPKAQLAGLAMHKPAEADTLHAAFDEEVKDHNQIEFGRWRF